MGARGRRWWAGLAVTALVAAGLASAARLTVNDGAIAAGKGAPAACDADGVTAYQVLSGTNVIAVDLGGVDATCAGGTVRVTVYNGADPSREGTATIPGGGGTVTVTLVGSVPLKDSHIMGIFLQGP